MDRAEFIAMLEKEGYKEFATVEREPHNMLACIRIRSRHAP